MYPFDPHTPPPPSPPSSPPMDPDSSPPGSPDMDNTISLNDEQPWPRSAFVNPLGGDWAQTRRPPLYERRGDAATPPRSSPRQDATVREYAYGATSSPIRDRHVQPPVDEDWLRDMYARGLAREIPLQSTSAQMRSRRTLGRELSQGVESDQTIWTRIVSDVIERKGDTNDCRTVIELTGNMIRQLTEISRCVADLKNLVVLPCPPPLPTSNNANNDESTSRQLERTSTSTGLGSTLGPPVRITSWSRVASEPKDVFNSSPSMSTCSAPPPTPLHEIHIFLAGNAIAKLPDELFEVANITILSLRQNQLREVPPGITCLVNLRDLNLASNQIEYLPSEILRMSSLMILNVTGNPFRPVPVPSPKDNSNTDPLKTIDPTVSASHMVSLPRHILDTTPPLVELCLRVLLAPHLVRTRKTPIRTTPSHDPRTEVPTNISVLYELIQPGETKLEYGLSKIISRCAPSAVAKSTGGGSSSSKPKTNMLGLRDFDTRYGAPLHYGLCPSSKHAGVRHPFYYHAEERITWETHVGRINLGTQRVPIRWRGCSRDCLDFLLHEEYSPVPPSPAVPEKALPPPPRLTAPPSSGLRFDEDF